MNGEQAKRFLVFWWRRSIRSGRVRVMQTPNEIRIWFHLRWAASALSPIYLICTELSAILNIRGSQSAFPVWGDDKKWSHRTLIDRWQDLDGGQKRRTAEKSRYSFSSRLRARCRWSRNYSEFRNFGLKSAWFGGISPEMKESITADRIQNDPILQFVAVSLKFIPRFQITFDTYISHYLRTLPQPMSSYLLK